MTTQGDTSTLTSSGPSPIFSASMSLRLQMMLWFGGMALGLMVLAGVYVGRIATSEVEATAGEAQYATARAIADRLGAIFREREQEIFLLSKSPVFMDADLRSPDILQVMEQRKSMRPEFAWMGVTDANGIVQHSTSGLLRNVNVSARDWYKKAQAGSYVGDVHEAVLLAKLLPKLVEDQPMRFLDFASPVFDRDGKLRGVLAAHVMWELVSRTVLSVVTADELDHGVEVLIGDRRGQVLYPEHAMGKIQLPTAGTNGATYTTMTWPDGLSYRTAEVRVKSGSANELDMRVVVRQPTAMAEAPVRALRDKLILYGLFAAGLFALAAWRLASRISRPVEELARAAELVERGGRNPEFPQAVNVQEVDRLSRGIRGMTQSLLRHQDELETVNASLEKIVAERTAALQAANRELERLAVTDGLTGVFNRRRFDEKLEELMLDMRRSGRLFSLMLVDADHFKRINDEYGHPVGDAVLKELTSLLGECTRATDFVARYGGEEFAVLVPDTASLDQAQTLAEKIRRNVEAANFPGAGRATVSIGVALSAPEDPIAGDLIRRCDAALYRAKSEGRNRVAA